MKIFNIILFTLLCLAKSFLCLGNGETTFQHIPPELYGNIAKQGIISVINESPDIFTAVEKVTDFLKKSRLISQAFSTQLTQNLIYNDLIKTFKDAMKAKFAPDLSHLSQEELNANLLQILREKYFETRSKGLLNLEEINNEVGKLIVAGASPNLVILQDNVDNNIYVDSLLSTAINFKLHKLIPLLLIYGADVNGRNVDFGSGYELYLKLEKQGLKYIFQSPLIEAILFPSPDDMNVLQQLINYKVDLNAKTEHGRTALEIASAHNKSDIVKLLKDHGAE